MNKFAVFAILLVAVAGAHANFTLSDDEGVSEFALRTTDEDETAGLAGKYKVFDQFCLESRDFVITSIDTTSNNAAKRVFNLFLNSAEDIAESTLQVSKNGAARLSQQLMNPESEIAPAANGAESIIVDGQEKIKAGMSQPQALLTAFASQLKAAGSEAYTQFSARVNQLRNQLSLAKLNEGVTAACDEASNYEKKIREDFMSVKGQMAENDASLANMNLEDVSCVTVRRVVRIVNLCRFKDAAQTPLKNLMMTARRAQ